MNGLFFCREFNALDLLQFLDTALYLLGFGRLIAEAVDEDFQLLDTLTLVAIRRFKLLEALGLRDPDTFRSCRDKDEPACSRSRQSC